MMTRAKIEKWLDKHIMICDMQKEFNCLFGLNEILEADDFNVSVCDGRTDGIHLYTYTNEDFYRLINILQVPTTFDAMWDKEGEYICAYFYYKDIKIFTLLTKGGNKK